MAKMTNNRLFKLSPSDFKYLWEDCKHCFYQKVVNGIELPSIGIPGIFMKMNSILQNSVQGTNPRDLHPDLPNGIFELQERYLKSMAIPSKNTSYVSGKFDLLTRLKDGTHGVIDLKITDPKEDNIYKFKHQLHAYKFALENPAEGTRRYADKITKMGLMVLSPNEVKFHNDHLHFLAKPHWIEIEENMAEFFAFIDEVTSVLEGPLPEPTEKCKWCIYRARFGNGENKVDDLPF